MPKSSIGPDGLELTDIQWLLDHHAAKISERCQMVDDLNVQPGDVVLDLGCGPGLWSAMFAQKVKPDGHIVGVDTSTELLAHAETRLKNEPLKDLIRYHKSDFSTIPLKDHSVDLVFFGNCFSYVTDHQKILDKQKRVMKPGGRIVAKDFEGANIIFHPIDPVLTLRVITAAARALSDQRWASQFDFLMGRKLHGLFRKSGLRNVSTNTYVIQKLSPLAPEEKRYIMGNGAWYGRIGAPYLPNADLAQWTAHFDPTSRDYILDREELYFSMLEVVTIGEV